MIPRTTLAAIAFVMLPGLMASAKGRPLPLLPAPTEVTAVVVSTSEIILTWARSAGAVGYRVYRDGAEVANVVAAPYSNTGLASGVSYSFSVAAYDATGHVGAKSTAITAPTVPGVLPSGSITIVIPPCPAGYTLTGPMCLRFTP